MRRRARMFASISGLVAAGLLIMHCGDASFDSTSTVDTDAGTDVTSQTDTSIPQDAAPPDAAQVDGAPPASPCTGASTHWICDDFDRTGSIVGGAYWSSSNAIPDGGASLAMMPPDGSAPPSPPNALVTIAGPDGQANVFRSGTISASGLACDFDFRVDQEGTDFTSSFALVSLYTTGGAAFYRLNAVLGPGHTAEGFADYADFSDGGSLVSLVTPTSLPRGAWTHLRIEVSLGPSGKVALFLNGAAQIFPTSIDLTNIGQTASGSLVLGQENGNGTAGQWTVAFDNAVCDLIP